MMLSNLLTGVVNTLLIRLTSHRTRNTDLPHGMAVTLPDHRKAMIAFVVGDDIQHLAKLVIDRGGTITRIGNQP